MRSTVTISEREPLNMKRKDRPRTIASKPTTLALFVDRLKC
jgi:hypothetical protein